jgi:hypothetical protein
MRENLCARDLETFLTFSRKSLKILSILVYIVLSMKPLGLDAIRFRILNHL